MKEIWKDIEGYEGLYQVSNLGRVLGRKGYILKPQKRQHGYLCVDLYKENNPKKRESIHRLVANAFIPNPKGYSEVNHKDECKQNNYVSNLEWTSHAQNSNYGSRGERIGIANRNGKKSKSIKQIDKKGNIIGEFPSLAEVRRKLNFDQSNISLCANGKRKTAYGYKWQFASEYQD